MITIKASQREIEYATKLLSHAGVTIPPNDEILGCWFARADRVHPPSGTRAADIAKRHGLRRWSLRLTAIIPTRYCVYILRFARPSMWGARGLRPVTKLVDSDFASSAGPSMQQGGVFRRASVGLSFADGSMLRLRGRTYVQSLTWGALCFAPIFGRLIFDILDLVAATPLV